MEHYWANRSCDPFTDRDIPCTLGNYVSYAVNVSRPSDVSAAILFARRHNIRFVVRNTAHDFLGRSTGAGALAAWTHHLKDATPLTWSDAHYSGSALRMGAGLQGFEAAAAAATAGQVVVGGLCPTVGIAGGYLQGGGHSHLSTAFGLAADQTLAFEAVSAAGEVVLATRETNPDLYWALSGGGGGTYAVVTSVTVRSYPDVPVGGALVVFDATTTSAENYSAALRGLYGLLPSLTDAGAVMTFVHNTTFFAITPLTLYNSTNETAKAILEPFTTLLRSLDIAFFEQYTTFPNFTSHWSAYYPLSGPVGTYWQFGGRLVQRPTLEDPASLSTLLSALATLAAEGTTLGITVLNATSRTAAPNAVLPAWRGASALVNPLQPWDEAPAAWERMRANQARGTASLEPLLDAATLGSGNYANEGDAFRADWREAFFGDNYDALLRVKQAWDPEGWLYGRENVGSEAWSVGEDGRMCRVGEQA